MKFAAALLALLLAGAAAAAPADKPVKLPDGRKLNLWCEGKSGPAVILDSGWSADSRAWGRVIAGLKDDFRVCAQDRAGSGLSDAGPLPRDGEAVARDLHAALEKSRLKGPYILVGHSLGGLNVRHFARLWPEQVAAMVLVDPSLPYNGPAADIPPATMARTCLAVARAGPSAEGEPQPARCRTSKPELAAVRWEARLSEIESFQTTTSSGLSQQQPGSLTMPLILLAAGKDAQAAPRFEAQKQQAMISTRGSAELVPDSGHMMMFDRPDAIIAAIRTVADEARTPPPSKGE
ncbi:alpha/beta fold hydrolase [Sandaracinobacteroides hominis]|uniref:alpha/beta fold hydrolase n=1 Tax=Sandaracinobacteroides hominis TaxID=2780086 RepID=UPI0018F5D5F8|nr:alpha/beta hydrolase [Sandaracinobacteroides hominis]